MTRPDQHAWMAARQFAQSLTPAQRKLFVALARWDGDQFMDQVIGQVRVENDPPDGLDDAERTRLAEVRYALGRMTAASHGVSQWLRGAIDGMSASLRDVMVAEVRTAVSTGRAGMDVDVAGWQAVLDHVDADVPAPVP